MASGEYYVFCGVCGCKVMNTEAARTEDKTWTCKGHVLRDTQDRDRTKGKFIKSTYPRIIYHPSRVPTFKVIVFLWEGIDEAWEDITDKWEQK